MGSPPSPTKRTLDSRSLQFTFTTTSLTPISISYLPYFVCWRSCPSSQRRRRGHLWSYYRGGAGPGRKCEGTAAGAERGLFPTCGLGLRRPPRPHPPPRSLPRSPPPLPALCALARCGPTCPPAAAPTRPPPPAGGTWRRRRRSPGRCRAERCSGRPWWWFGVWEG